MAKNAGKSGGKKIGRDAEKGKRYRGAKTRERNKLKRILRSNGRKAGEAYALEHNLKLPAARE